MHVRAVLRDAYEAFLGDSARWVQPEGRVPVDTLTRLVVTKLLYRYPSLRAMAWFRLGGALKEIGIPGTSGWIQRRLLRLYGLELSTGIPVGRGLYIAHPVGCVLHATSIGADVTVISNVTFGTRTDNAWPTIEDGARFGVGARVLGGIVIGAGASIGANAVVLHDVPSGVTAVGVPARIVVGSPVAASEA
ncbi:MAG: serine acetyltransferase [Ilumatobacteraceae bacterium]